MWFYSVLYSFIVVFLVFSVCCKALVHLGISRDLVFRGKSKWGREMSHGFLWWVRFDRGFDPLFLMFANFLLEWIV